MSARGNVVCLYNSAQNMQMSFSSFVDLFTVHVQSRNVTVQTGNNRSFVDIAYSSKRLLTVITGVLVCLHFKRPLTIVRQVQKLLVGLGVECKPDPGAEPLVRPPKAEYLAYMTITFA